MLSKTLAVQMRLVRKINMESLINMRSLMVMVCILSVSVNASVRHQDYGETEWKDARAKKNVFQWMQRKTASRNWLIALSVALLAAIFIPGSDDGIMCTDSGASLVLRLAVVIPGTVLLGGALYTAHSRYKMLQNSKTVDEYNRNVRSSNDAKNTLLATNIAMLIALIVVCLVATLTFGENGNNHIAKFQSYMSVIVLSIGSIAGFVAWGKLISCCGGSQVAEMAMQPKSVSGLGHAENNMSNLQTGNEFSKSDCKTERSSVTCSQPEKGESMDSGEDLTRSKCNPDLKTLAMRRRLCRAMNYN